MEFLSLTNYIVYILAWVFIVVACEMYIKLNFVEDNDDTLGVPPDDDAREMSRMARDRENAINSELINTIRAVYLVSPIALFVLFLILN
jgi:hypothetical protein